MSNYCSFRTQLSKKRTLIKHFFPPLCIWAYFVHVPRALAWVSRGGIALLLTHSQALVESPGERKRVYLLASKRIIFSKNETGGDWKTTKTTKEKGRQFPPQDRLYPNLEGKLDTVKLRFTDTRLTRAVCFVPGGKKPLHLFKFNPLYTNTPLIRTLSMAPLASVLTGVYRTQVMFPGERDRVTFSWLKLFLLPVTVSTLCGFRDGNEYLSNLSLNSFPAPRSRVSPRVLLTHTFSRPPSMEANACFFC